MTASPDNAASQPVSADLPMAGRVRPWLVRAATAVVLVLVAVWAVADYRAFQSQEDRATEILDAVGGQRVGSIGGWLIGRENVVRLDRELTDEEVDRLAELGRLGSGHTYTIRLQNWKPSAGRLDELRRKLGKRCTVLTESPSREERK